MNKQYYFIVCKFLSFLKRMFQLNLLSWYNFLLSICVVTNDEEYDKLRISSSDHLFYLPQYALHATKFIKLMKNIFFYTKTVLYP